LLNESGKLSPEKKGRLVQRRGKRLGMVDLHVASRVRERRIVLGISQPKMAAALGLAFQQLYKYEQGKNRISAGRLYELGKVLDVPITFFFEEIADASTPVANLASGGDTDESSHREAIELFIAYRAIADPVVRLRLRELARALGSEPNGPTAKPSASQSCRPSRRVRSDRDGGTRKR